MTAPYIVPVYRETSFYDIRLLDGGIFALLPVATVESALKCRTRVLLMTQNYSGFLARIRDGRSVRWSLLKIRGSKL